MALDFSTTRDDTARRWTFTASPADGHGRCGGIARTDDGRLALFCRHRHFYPDRARRCAETLARQLDRDLAA